jgi:uncharacterized protein (TIGR03382 family)
MLSFALAFAAYGFAPADHLGSGWDLEPQRIRQYHGQVQAEFVRSPAWQRFTRAEGAGWRGRFDELTGVPHRMFGAGIDMGPVSTREEVVKGVMGLIDRNPDLFGVSGQDLTPRSVRYAPTLDIWYVELDEVRGGIPVFHGGVTARVRFGKLVMMGADTWPGVPVTGHGSLTAGEALDAAITHGPASWVEHTDVSSELKLLPLTDADELQLRRVWEIRSTTADPVGQWVSLVDAETGELHNVHNLVRFFAGSVYASHDERTVDGTDPVESPLEGLRITNGSDWTATDEFGEYQIKKSPDGVYETSLQGDLIRVQDVNGNAELLFENKHPTFSANDASQAALDTYVFLDQVRQWGQVYAPEVGWTHGVNTSYVNLDDVCNAYYDGNLNFFRAGSGCNNTGRIADVNYHEWGHGFHDHSLLAGWFDGSISEGIGDTVSFLQTKDNEVAPYFNTNGWGIRDVDNDQRYPEDYSLNAAAVHFNGLIFGGSMWDLYNIIALEEGREYALDVTSKLLAGLIKGGPDIEAAYDEAILVDDDDGDLSNGTPHECYIVEAFGRHGLGPLGATSLVTGHEPLSAQLPDVDIDVTAMLESPSPNCFEYDPVNATVTYRINAGNWETVDLDMSSDDVRGTIPGQPAGTYVEYFLTVRDRAGVTLRAPDGGDINPYSFYVGDVIVVQCDDFEEGNADFTHALLKGEEAEGADDWQWGRPQGMSGDPESAHSGKKVWGNDLGGGEFNGAYQPEKHNVLTSPVYQTKHYQDVYLNYWRWLNVEDGFFDNAWIEADEHKVWRNHETVESNGGEHTRDAQWTPQAIDLYGQVDDGEVQVSWHLKSDGGLEMGGWTLDDVCLMAPATADNRLGINDLELYTNDGFPALSWTNPPHAPLTEIRLVRKLGGLPTSVNDGVVVFQADEPELGGESYFVDSTSLGARSGYAVYASDGETWLSWTVEGWNAVDGPASDAEVVGCGCSSTPVGLSLGWLVVLAPLARRRR